MLPGFRPAAGKNVVSKRLLGVTGEDMQCDPYQEELPGSGWGNTASEALAEAGYQLV